MSKEEELQNYINDLEREVKQSKEQFQSIIERSIDGVLIVDEMGTVRFINPAACEILGIEREEIVSETFGFPVISKSSTEIDILYKGKKRVAEMRVVDTFWEKEKAFLVSLRDITKEKREDQLRRETLERAKKIQSSLFPSSLPPFPAMELAGEYQQAENLGGDFFDIRPFKDGVLLLMADVTGHGMDAALITIFLSTFLRRELELGDDSKHPLELLKKLQRDFFNQGFPDDYSLEVFLAFISFEPLEIIYAAAGNIRAFLLNKDSMLEKLPYSHGALINNTITHPLFGSYRMALSPKQTLLIYTDGVDEPILFRDPTLGPIYLQKILQNTLELLPVEEVLERILGDMLIQIGDEPKDDMAILALKPKKEITHKREWTCPPITEELYPITDMIINDLKDLPVDHHMVRMALQEAISNAIVHTPAQKSVLVNALWNQKELIISVQDHGPGFNWRQTLEKRYPLLGEQERGRGLTIIEMAADSFTLNHRGNKIVMSWPLNASSSTLAI